MVAPLLVFAGGLVLVPVEAAFVFTALFEPAAFGGLADFPFSARDEGGIAAEAFAPRFPSTSMSSGSVLTTGDLFVSPFWAALLTGIAMLYGESVLQALGHAGSTQDLLFCKKHFHGPSSGLST